MNITHAMFAGGLIIRCMCAPRAGSTKGNWKMTEDEIQAILNFGRANLSAVKMKELEILARGEWNDDEDACWGFVYEESEPL